MNYHYDQWKIVTGSILLSVFFIIGGYPVQAANQSTNVAIIGTSAVSNGGCFPTTVDGFTSFNFFNINRTLVTLANLSPGGVCGAAGCDTVLLNVSSSTYYGGVGCNVATNLSAQAKADLISFVAQGGKLIIYDSECSPQDYSWLPYPFTTTNPGATGSKTGVLTIVEENVLSSASSLSAYYINAAQLISQTDAIGDMNVMVTYNPNWCLDMSGTNVYKKTGPVHTYARYGNGLIIYNGWDMDYNACATPPSTTGAGNISKTWHQELMTPFNPTPIAALPCGVTVVGINLTPTTASNDLGMKDYEHTVIAHLTDLLNTPQQNILVTFTVTGTNAGAYGTCSPANCQTDANGNVFFTYGNTNHLKGQDTITACFVNQAQQTICSQGATKTWVMKCDLNNDNSIDRLDISIIMAGRGLNAPGDPRDIDGDGWITVNDARACVLQCSKTNCIP